MRATAIAIAPLDMWRRRLLALSTKATGSVPLAPKESPALPFAIRWPHMGDRMPRDAVPPSALVLRLPGHRTARVCPADDAGETRLQVIDGTPLDRLMSLGWIDTAEHEAGLTIASLFEQTGLRQRVAVQFDGGFTDNTGSCESLFEKMGRSETRAWRQLHQMLAKVPLHSRGEVQAVCIAHLAPVSLARLRTGLSAIAQAISRPRRR